MILGWDGMRRSLVLAALAAVLMVAAPAMAQTPVVSCGADSLYLFSPGTLGMELATSGRAGLTLTWPDLDPNLATCFALTDEEGLGFTVEATGGFGDRVDRQLLFTATSAGTIGGAEADHTRPGAEGGGHVVAEGQAVERADEDDRQDQAGQQVGRHRARGLPALRREAARKSPAPTPAPPSAGA